MSVLGTKQTHIIIILIALFILLGSACYLKYMNKRSELMLHQLKQTSRFMQQIDFDIALTDAVKDLSYDQEVSGIAKSSNEIWTTLMSNPETADYIRNACEQYGAIKQNIPVDLWGNEIIIKLNVHDFNEHTGVLIYSKGFNGVDDHGWGDDILPYLWPGENRRTY